MKIKSILTSALVFALLILVNSCSKDESSPALKFVFDGQSYTLKGANLYLTHQENTFNGTHKHRDYFISDGTYTNAEGDDGWDFDDYDNATYFVAIELAVPLEDDFGAGEFPQHGDWDNVALANSNMSWIGFEMGEDDDYFECSTEDDYEDFSPVVVSGGVEDGDTMTLKFSGKLEFYHFDGLNWV